MYSKAISQKGSDVLLDIEVSPNSKKFEISGFNQWRNSFEIRIKQVPQKGKANKEIVKELSSYFDHDVSIFKGEKSSKKTMLIKNADKSEILEKLI